MSGDGWLTACIKLGGACMENGPYKNENVMSAHEMAEHYILEIANIEPYKNMCLAFQDTLVPTMSFALMEYVTKTMSSCLVKYDVKTMSFAWLMLSCLVARALCLQDYVSAVMKACAQLGLVLVTVKASRFIQVLWVKLMRLIGDWFEKVEKLVRSGLTCPLRGRDKRKQRRKSHLSRMLAKKQMRLVLMLSCLASCHAMEAAQVIEQVARLTEAAASAARAAAEASSRLSAQASSSSTGTTLEAATKILKSPDTFTGEDPAGFVNWKMQFESWLGYGDAKCAEMLSKVELSKSPPDSARYSAEEKAISKRFYAVLSSYLRGSCLQLVRANYAERDGFRLWFEMIKEFVPSPKQRALALAQALSQFPAFKEKSSMLEGVLQYETLVQQYEAASGQTYPGDLKAATLIRCSPPRLREHLQLSLSDVSTYADVREALLSYERVSRSFSQEQIYKQLQVEDSKADGPTPMEVDRVEYKGKGKGKKGKGKKGSWWNSGWSFGGRGRGSGGGRGRKGGKGKGRGKGKGKNKGFSYGKGKNKGKKGGGKDSGCHLCGALVHWSRECPNKMVNYVGQQQFQQSPQTEAQQPAVQTPVPTSMSTTSSLGSQATISYPHSQFRGTSTTSTVRRLYDVRGPQHSPSSSSSCRMVKMSVPFDGFHQWMNGELDIDGGGHVFVGEIHRISQPLSVRPVQWPCEKGSQVIILDS